MKFSLRVLSNTPNSYNNRPLHTAAYFNHTNTLQYLIDREAEINLQNSQGATALHLATSNNNIEAAAMLLEAGANPDSVDSNRMSARALADASDDVELIELFETYGAKVSTPLSEMGFITTTNTATPGEDSEDDEGQLPGING